MKKYVFIIDGEKVLEKVMSGKSVQGGFSWNKETGLTFNAHNIQSREDGYVSPEKTLFETTDGRLMETPQRYKIKVSVKRRLGHHRAATEIQNQARELTDHLKHTKTIEDILDEV